MYTNRKLYGSRHALRDSWIRHPEPVMYRSRQIVHARLLEYLVLQQMRRTMICPQLTSVMVAPADGEGNWIIQTYDPGPHRAEDCSRAFALILPDLMVRYALARD